MGFESCHPAVNFLFFACRHLRKRGLPAPGVSRHLLPVRLRVQHEAERKTGGYLQPVPAAAGGLLRPVLQQLSPFRRDGAETELHRQQPDGGKLRVRHGDGTAGGGSVHVAELPVPGGVQRQGAVPVRAGSAHGCHCFSQFCCALFRESAGRQEKSTWLRRASAGEAIREMFFDDLSTACGFSPC